MSYRQAGVVPLGLRGGGNRKTSPLRTAIGVVPLSLRGGGNQEAKQNVYDVGVVPLSFEGRRKLLPHFDGDFLASSVPVREGRRKQHVILGKVVDHIGAPALRGEEAQLSHTREAFVPYTGSSARVQ